MKTTSLHLLVYLALAAFSACTGLGEDRGQDPTWLSDYFQARDKAEEEQKQLFIWFTSDKPGKVDSAVETLMAKESIAKRLDDYVCLKLPISAKVTKDGKESRLLQHSSMAEMRGVPGIGILDFSDKQSANFATLVTAYPFRGAAGIDEVRLQVLLNLPSGTLTQRTMVYAVRTHRDAPRSTSGTYSPMLAQQATLHSSHQARIRVQGHHNWNARFYQINAKLPRGLLSQEVCAESWPGQSLIEAAEECVDSWRQSPGHWSAVRASQPLYGYDMKRGSNGVWYATGIFGNRG